MKGCQTNSSYGIAGNVQQHVALLDGDTIKLLRLEIAYKGQTTLREAIVVNVLASEQCERTALKVSILASGGCRAAADL